MSARLSIPLPTDGKIDYQTFKRLIITVNGLCNASYSQEFTIQGSPMSQLYIGLAAGLGGGGGVAASTDLGLFNFGPLVPSDRSTLTCNAGSIYFGGTEYPVAEYNPPLAGARDRSWVYVEFNPATGSAVTTFSNSRPAQAANVVRVILWRVTYSALVGWGANSIGHLGDIYLSNFWNP